MVWGSLQMPSAWHYPEIQYVRLCIEQHVCIQNTVWLASVKSHRKGEKSERKKKKKGICAKPCNMHFFSQSFIGNRIQLGTCFRS